MMKMVYLRMSYIKLRIIGTKGIILLYYDFQIDKKNLFDKNMYANRWLLEHPSLPERRGTVQTIIRNTGRQQNTNI